MADPVDRRYQKRSVHCTGSWRPRHGDNDGISVRDRDKIAWSGLLPVPGKGDVAVWIHGCRYLNTGMSCNSRRHDINRDPVFSLQPATG